MSVVMYNYHWVEWAFIFYIYSILGWIFESTVVSIKQRKFVNRGFLRGPMLPIYGLGAVLILNVAQLFGRHPVQLFFAGMLLATLFEYIVGWLMESIFKMQYWDYSTHKFQFQGRICLQSSLAWGVLSVALPYVLHRPVAALLQRFSPQTIWICTGIFTLYFVVDGCISVRAAQGLKKMLQELEEIREQIEVVRAQLAEQDEKTNIQLAALEKDMDTQDAAVLQEQREKMLAACEESRLQLHLALRERDTRLDERVKAMRRTSKRMVHGNPKLHSGHYTWAVEEVRRRLKTN